MSMQFPSMPSSVAETDSYSYSETCQLRTNKGLPEGIALMLGAPMRGILSGEGICLGCPNLPTSLSTDVSAV